MRKWLPLLVLLLFTILLPALGFWAGHRFAYQRMRKQPWQVNQIVADRVDQWRKNETLSGAFAIAGIPLDGLEKCYYSPPDFTRITWIGKDIPTPFVGFAPAPGPIASGHINTQQFRYEREVMKRKPRGAYRIFLVGGSTAYGSGASSNETTIAGYLEKYLSEQSVAFGCKIEVVTAAACAWASTHERIMIENRLVEFEPDLVIALSGHNDAYWSAANRNTLWFRAFQDDYFHLLANSLLSCNFDEELPDTPPGVDEQVTPKDTADRLVRNVRLAHHALQLDGADYCFALQPILAASRKPRTPREQRRFEYRPQTTIVAHYAEFRGKLAVLDLPNYHFVDLTGIFDKVDEQTDIFIDGCHFGDRGNDQIAQALRDRLTPMLRQRIRNDDAVTRRNGKPAPSP